MNKNSLQKLKMYLVVFAYLKLNISVWTASAVFTAAVGKLEEGIAAIKTDDKVDKKTKSETATKKQFREKMFDATMPVCNAGVAFAANIGDPALGMKFDYSRSDLGKGNEEEVYNRCVNIGLAAKPILEKLVSDYDLSSDQLIILNEAATAYNDDMTTNREKRTAGKTINKDMTKEYKAVDVQLKKVLDKLVDNYATSAPKFWAGYQDARYIGGWSEPPVPPVPPVEPTV